MHSSHASIDDCPKEVKDSRTENRWQAALRSTTKTILSAMPTESVSAQILPLFVLLKVKKQQHCSALFLWVLMEENPQQGPEPPALTQVPCIHRATLPLLQGKAGASQMLLLLPVSRQWEELKWGLVLREQQVYFSLPSWLSVPPVPAGRKQR